MKSSPSPTKRTLAWCKARNWMAGVVERWNPHAKIRQDLFGFIDLIAVGEHGLGTIAIQATSASNAAARITKIQANESARRWIASGNLVEVHGWRKNAKKRWVLNRWRLGLHQGEIDAVRLEDEP